MAKGEGATTGALTVFSGHQALVGISGCLFIDDFTKGVTEINLQIMRVCSLREDNQKITMFRFLRRYNFKFFKTSSLVMGTVIHLALPRFTQKIEPKVRNLNENFTDFFIRPIILKKHKTDARFDRS